MLISALKRVSTILSTVLFLVTLVQGRMASQTSTLEISPSTLNIISEFIRLEAATTVKNTTVVQPVFKTKTD